MLILRPKITLIFVGLADGAIGVEQTLSEFVKSCAAPEDEVVAELDLREEQPMPAASFLPLPGGKERRKARQPLLSAAQQIPSGERVGELLWPDRKYGWFIEPNYSYSFGSEHEQSLGVSVGLLVPIQ